MNQSHCTSPTALPQPADPDHEYRLRNDKDLLGIGLNWGKPNPNQGAGDDAQYAAEVFYRYLVGKRINLTADLQYIKDPVINTAESSIWVIGVRGRFAF